jgi:hypothetical protein
MNETICLTENIDFVVPIKKVGLFTRAVLEGIHSFYRPRRIIVIIQQSEIVIFIKLSQKWNLENIEMIDETLFFQRNFHLTMEDLEKEFQTTNDKMHREFGWWYQQMIKLGASTQIPNISDPYVVWDGDLIPLKKWEIALKNTTEGNTMHYYVSILQDQSKSEFNKQEYNKCIHHLLGFDCFAPSSSGTFVTHHMVFYVNYVKEMLDFILERNHQAFEHWPMYFISLSKQFYRFSEYMLYASFMMKYHENKFLYYPYEKYGKTGLRFRETKEIISNLISEYSLQKNECFTYQEITDYFNKKTPFPSYVQFEHVYYLL